MSYQQLLAPAASFTPMAYQGSHTCTTQDPDEEWRCLSEAEAQRCKTIVSPSTKAAASKDTGQGQLGRQQQNGFPGSKFPQGTDCGRGGLWDGGQEPLRTSPLFLCIAHLREWLP